MKILKNYIHQDFEKTLVVLLELRNNPQNSAEVDLSIFDEPDHKHFVSWAFVTVWGERIRKHLIKL